MIDVFIAILVTLTVLVIVVPLTLFILLLRQILRTRVGSWLVGAVGGPRRTVPAGRGRGALAVQPMLRRQWGQLANDAAAAGARFAAAAESVPAGPLRSALDGARSEVAEAVAEAQRLAVQGDRTERAYREVLSALDAQRRRRRGAHGPLDVERELAAATRAQHDSAERLAALSRSQLCRLQLVVARLHGLTAHALELATLDQAPQLSPSSTIADRLAALRLATAEVETAAVV